MEGFDGGGAQGNEAGLVLLYAARHDEIPAAIPLTGELVIGREPPENGLRLPQPAASRVHARIERKGAVWRVVDLDSRNGVLVNGLFVRDKILADRDELRIGDTIFEFRVDDVRPYAAHRLDGSIAPDAEPAVAPEIVGGHRMRAIARVLARIARTPLPVLVLGETGTGKEVVARALHRMSGRGPFVALNCAAIPANLVERELFGADRDREGIVSSAEGGTLLLDEIGDMPLDAQAKLLRLLETREVIPLGSTTGTKVDVRIVCATHRDLGKLAREERFRADLHARIQGYTVSLPPLRERKEDLFLLARHFLRAEARGDAAISFRFMLALCRHAWPYNVRELAQAIQRAALVAGGADLDEAHLPQSVRDSMKGYGEDAPDAAISSGSLRAASTGAPSADELRAAMKEEQGNVSAVARRFKKDRTQINRWLRLHRISPDEFRRPET
jgi:DNA-binding NtrC family response regulator